VCIHIIGDGVWQTIINLITPVKNPEIPRLGRVAIREFPKFKKSRKIKITNIAEDPTTLCGSTQTYE